MGATFKYRLFEAFGVELEYMVVDRDTLKVKPIVDRLLYDFSGNYSGNYENGSIDWSNELVAHVLELKVHQPVSSLSSSGDDFAQNIRQVNQHLEKYNAMLLPGAMHPTFNPLTETTLWKHDSNEIYSLYNRVFDCRGHGWSNLQSTHLNLPFSDADEFARLHAAVRVILPLIPGIAASSPITDGKLRAYQDSRMWYYLNNQKRIPSLMGKLIPEPVYTREDYFRQVFQPIVNDFIPFDPAGIMKPYFLNSRGAIARFDRAAIEIRVMDVQECPKADLCIVQIIVALLKTLCDVEKDKMEHIKQMDTDLLCRIFKKAIQYGGNCLIEEKDYLALFGCTTSAVRINDLWTRLLDTAIELEDKERETARHVLKIGTLSSRIARQFNKGKSITAIYRTLANCAQENEWFEG